LSQVVEDIGPGQRPGKEEREQAGRLVVRGGLGGQRPGVPNPYGPIPAGADNLVAVRGEQHAVNVTRMTPQGEGFLTGDHVPDLYRLVGSARGEPGAVRAEC